MEKDTLLKAVKKHVAVGEEFTGAILARRAPDAVSADSTDARTRRVARQALRRVLLHLVESGHLKAIGTTDWGANIYRRVR